MVGLGVVVVLSSVSSSEGEILLSWFKVLVIDLANLKLSTFPLDEALCCVGSVFWIIVFLDEVPPNYTECISL